MQYGYARLLFSCNVNNCFDNDKIKERTYKFLPDTKLLVRHKDHAVALHAF